MAKKSSGDSLFVLQISVAVFFVLFGLVGIVNYNSDLNRFGRTVVQFFGGKSDALNLIVAILGLAAGIIVALALFDVVGSKVRYFALLGVLVFWVLRIIYVFFVNNIFKPEFLFWLQQLSIDVVVLASVWLIARKHA